MNSDSRRKTALPRGRPPIAPPPPVGQIIRKTVRPLARRYGGALPDLKIVWADIAGHRYAKLSRPLGFVRRPNGKKGLKIAVKGPARALLQADSGRVVEAINRVFGGEPVESLVLIPFSSLLERETRSRRTPETIDPPSEKKLQTGLKSVPEGRLKAALARLGTGAYGRKTP